MVTGRVPQKATFLARTRTGSRIGDPAGAEFLLNWVPATRKTSRMDFPIVSYKLFWDAGQRRGGVTVALQPGRAIPLLTHRPEVLRLWADILLTGHAVYYTSGESEGIATAWQTTPLAVTYPGPGAEIGATPSAKRPDPDRDSPPPGG